MSDYLGLIFMVMYYAVFKYSVYMLAPAVDVDSKLSLIPGVDIYVVTKCVNMPIWLLVLMFIPVVNGIVCLYLVFKNPYAFFVLNPVIGPVLLYKEAKEIIDAKEKNVLDKVMTVVAIIVKIITYVCVGLMLLCGGFLLLMAYNYIMRRHGYKIVYYSMLLDYLRF